MSSRPNGEAHPLGGFAVCLTVQDNLNNETRFEFETRLAQSAGARG